MRRGVQAAVAALFLLALAGCGGAQAGTSGQAGQSGGASSPAQSGAASAPEPAPPTAEELAAARIDSLLSGMTLEEQVGQCFFVRCPAEEALADVTTYHLGGYLLFTRDFQDSAGGWLTEAQFTQTVADYQAAALADSGVPLLIGSDEEGGSVTRASRNPNLFERKFPSPQQLAAADTGDGAAFARDAADKSAALLALGINVNLAPVCDVSTDPGDFIYDRALGRDAAATADYVTEVVSAMAEAGMGSVLKHFPGYGDNADTHTGIAVDGRAMETFTSSDLLPFRAGIAAGDGTAAVLVSHNIVQCMDGSLPASLSPAVHDLLRRELGFDGVVMTDDLAMEAVAAYAGDGAAAVMALQAGNDLVVTSDYRAQIPKVLEAVADGTLDEAAVEAACRRVLTWKQRLGLLP